MPFPCSNRFTVFVLSFPEEAMQFLSVFISDQDVIQSDRYVDFGLASAWLSGKGILICDMIDVAINHELFPIIP